MLINLIRRISQVCLFLISFFVITPAYANYPCNEDCWTNILSVYSWVIGQNGSILSQGNTSNFDITPMDVLENLGLIDFILQMHIETQKGRWAFMIDPNWVKVTIRTDLIPPEPSKPQQITTTSRFTLVDFAAFYTFAANCIPRTNMWYKFEVYAGGRILSNESDLILQPASITITDGATWLGAMLGIRASLHVTDKIRIWMRADVSGGRGNRTISGQGYISYAITKHLLVSAGYRAMDFIGFDGSNVNRYKLDAVYYGPAAGLILTW